MSTTTSKTFNKDNSITESTTTTRSDGSSTTKSENYKLDWGGFVKDTISVSRTENPPKK